VPLRIGCDLDGVLADMESELVRQARLLFGDIAPTAVQPPAPSRDTDSSTDGPAVDPSVPRVSGLFAMGLSERQQRRLWRHVESIDGFWETLTEIEAGAVSTLASLASDRRWELIFLTKRPESAGATVQIQTQRWLQAHGFQLPSVFVVHGSRGRVADALNLNFVVDDRPENCLDVVIDSTARAILVWREDESQLPAGARRLGVDIVRSTAESFEVLTRADRPANKSAGLVERLRRRLGFGEPSGQ
jgi:hypothetical protein